MLKFMVIVENDILGIKYDIWSGMMTIGGKIKSAVNVKILAKEYFLTKKEDRKITGSRSRYCIKCVVPELTFDKGIARLKNDFEVTQVERLERIFS